MNGTFAYVVTNAGLTVFFDNRPTSVAKTDAVFEEVLAVIKSKDITDKEAQVKALLHREEERLKAAAHRIVTSNIAITNGIVTYRDTPVDNSATRRMLVMLDEGFELGPMAAFLENLMNNPSYKVVQDLYAFLEYGKLPLTEDGCFLAYKKVREDYKDIYTGTMDNSVGCTPSMARNQVEDDPNKTCSKGLHVCSFEYLPHFGADTGNRVMVCKVNPADVVSIPTDYNNTKMRVCKYEVVGEVDREGAAKNVLGNTTVAAELPDTRIFAVELVDEDGNVIAEERFDKFVEAATFLEDVDGCDLESHFEQIDWETDPESGNDFAAVRARLVNLRTGAELHEVVFD